MAAIANAVTFDLFARDQASGAFVKVGRAAASAGRDVEGLGRKADSLSGHFTAISRIGPRSFGLIATGAKAAGLALGGAALTGAAFGLKTAASMETAKIGFTTMLGSAEKAGAFLKDLQQFAAATPFEFPELQTAASSLISVGINAKDVIPIMRTLGNVTAGMGTGSEGIKRATVALQQMTAAQRITAEDLNQLRDAGIPVYDLLAAATGKTKAQVVKLAQAGKLGKKELDQMMDALESGKGLERFNGLMEKQSQSLSGIFSTLKDNVSMTLANLVTPAIPAVEAGLSLVSSAVTKAGPVIQGALDGLVGFIRRTVVPGFEAMGAAFSGEGVTSDGFIGVMETIGDRARTFVDFIKKTIIPGLQGFASAFSGEGITSDGFVGVMETIGDRARTALTWLQQTFLPGVVQVFKDLGTKVKENLPKIDLSGLATTFKEQASKWGGGIIDGIKTGLDTGDWSGLGQTIGKGIVSAVSAAGSFVKTIAGKIGDLLGRVDWVGIGLAVGKQVPSLLIGIAAGILNFDLGGLLKGLAKHWQDILLAVLALAFAPAKLVGKVGELLARIPLVGKLLEWGLLHMKQFADRMVGAVFDALKFLGRSFLEGFRRVFPGIGEGFLAHLRNLPTYIAVVTLEVIGKAKLMMARLAGAISGGIGGVVAKIGELIGRMLKPFANAAGWLIGKGRELIGGLLNGITGKFVDVGKWLAGVGTRIRAFFASVGGWLRDKGSAIIGGLWQGFKDAMASVGKVLSDVKDKIVGGLKHLFGIRSPSTVMAGIGGHIITGLIKGMLTNSGALARTVKSIGGTVANIFGGVGDLAFGKATSFGAVEKMVQGYASLLYGWTGSQWTALRALIMGESGFNPNAQNPTSSAYGLGQFLDSTWGFVGFQKTSDPGTQARATLKYIAQVYGNPVNAFSAWLNRRPHWYGSGLAPTVFSRPTLIGVGERGPETVSVTPQRMIRPGGGGRTYNVNVYVAPGGNLREAGRQLVEAIQAYETGSGKGWRTA